MCIAAVILAHAMYPPNPAASHLVVGGFAPALFPRFIQSSTNISSIWILAAPLGNLYIAYRLVVLTQAVIGFPAFCRGAGTSRVELIAGL